MSFQKADQFGDKVVDKTKRHTVAMGDKLVKVRPDGAKVIKTKEGTLKTIQKPNKPVKDPNAS